MTKRILRLTLLSIYFIALLADCYLLYYGKYEKRFLCRPLLMPCMMIYLSTRKSIKRKSSVPPRTEIILLWVALTLSWLSDILATRSAFWSLLSCLSLYLLIYPVYIVLFFTLAKRHLPKEVPFKPNLSSMLVFAITTIAGAIYLRLYLHLGFKLSYVPHYFNILLLAFLLSAVSFLTTFPKMYPAIYQLFSAVILILFANAIYAIADFADPAETNTKLYVFVALGYGLSQLLIVSGLINFFKTNQLEKEEEFSKRNKEIREQREVYYKK